VGAFRTEEVQLPWSLKHANELINTIKALLLRPRFTTDDSDIVSSTEKLCDVEIQIY